MPENLPVLYSFRRCPYAMRARMALHTSDTVLEHREIELKNKPAAMLAASPKGTVPVLVLPDGRVIDESLDIMRWALAKRDPLHWWPPADQEPAALDLIAQNDGPFKEALDRYKYPYRFGLNDGISPRDAGAGFLHALEERLQTQVFLNGSTWGLIDAALAPFVRQFAHTDKAWFSQQPWPRLAQWLADFEASDLFAAIMHKRAPWVAGLAPLATGKSDLASKT